MLVIYDNRVMAKYKDDMNKKIGKNKWNNKVSKLELPILFEIVIIKIKINRSDLFGKHAC